MTRNGKLALAGGLIALIGVGGALAQQMHGRFGPPGMGPMMGGPMGGRMMERLCSGDPAQFTERMGDHVAGRLRITDAQKPALKDLEAAVTKAFTDAKVMCAEKPDMTTAGGRLAAAERRIEFAYNGLKTIHPKLDAFYAVLDDTQKAKFNAIGPSGPRRERGMQRGGQERGGPERSFGGPGGWRGPRPDASAPQ